MSEFKKYVKLIEQAIVESSDSDLELSILSDWDGEYKNIDDLIDGEGVEDVIEHLLDDGMKKELYYLFKHEGIYADVNPSHGNDDAAIIALSNGLGIIRYEDGKTYSVYSDAESLIYEIDEDFLFSFFCFDEDKESNEFWESIGGNSFAYHATNESNVEDILEDGLESRYGSRGLTNRDTGAAVFTTLRIEEINNNVYGDAHIKINLGAMKKDGYMPKVAEEYPLIEDRYRSAIAHIFGIEYESANNDLSPETLVIFGDIPPEYLELMDWIFWYCICNDG